jgi:hypothetical protein
LATDGGAATLLKWLPPAVALALFVYVTQLAYRLAQDEALLRSTAETVKERTHAFETMIKLETRVDAVEAEVNRRKSIIDQVPVSYEEQRGLHAALNERVSRLWQIVDRIEIRLEALIKQESEEHSAERRPHGTSPEAP